MMDASHDPEVIHAALENDCLSQCPSKPFVPLLGGPDHVVAIVHLDDPPAQTALFSRRELRRALDLLDALDPEDQRVEVALLEASAPVLVARPRDATGEGWVAVAGHSEVAESAAPAACSKPEPAAPAPKKPIYIPPVKVDPAPGPKPEPKPKAAPVKVPIAVDPAPAPTPAPKQEEPAPKRAEEKPAAPATEEVCEQCGGPVTKTQKQMSQLFLNKTLCKACMDAATKGASE